MYSCYRALRLHLKKKPQNKGKNKVAVSGAQKKKHRIRTTKRNKYILLELNVFFDFKTSFVEEAKLGGTLKKRRNLNPAGDRFFFAHEEPRLGTRESVTKRTEPGTFMICRINTKCVEFYLIAAVKPILEEISQSVLEIFFACVRVSPGKKVGRGGFLDFPFINHNRRKYSSRFLLSRLSPEFMYAISDPVIFSTRIFARLLERFPRLNRRLISLTGCELMLDM